VAAREIAGEGRRVVQQSNREEDDGYWFKIFQKLKGFIVK
jgi:hypothetical protein